MGTTEQAVLPAGLADMAPGHDLARALSTVDRTRLTGPQMALVVAARGRQVNHNQALLLADVNELAKMPWDGGGEPTREQADDFSADQIAMTLVLSQLAAYKMWGLGEDLLTRLPMVYEAMLAGRIDYTRAKAFSDTLALLDLDTAQRIAASMLAKAEVMTAGQLRARLAYRASKADPGLAKERYRRSVTDRRVFMDTDSEGTAKLCGLNLPVDRAAAAENRIERLARAAKADGDSRNLAQLRADALLDVLAGVPFQCRPGHDPFTADADREAAEAAPKDAEEAAKSADGLAATREALQRRAAERDARWGGGEPNDANGNSSDPGAGEGAAAGAAADREQESDADRDMGTPGRPAADSDSKSGRGPEANQDHRADREANAGWDADAVRDADSGWDADAERDADAVWHAAWDTEWHSDAAAPAERSPGADRPPDRAAANDHSRPGPDRDTNTGHAPDATTDPDREPGWNVDAQREAEATWHTAWLKTRYADPIRDTEPPGPGMCTCQRVQPAERRGTVELVVSLTTLAKLDDNPGLIPGWGPVIADIARQIAHDQLTNPQWKWSATDHTGQLRHHGHTSRRFNATETAFIQARDRTCRFPGCRKPATRCDIDHRTQHSKGGPSHRGNGCCECRRHHRFKHEKKFTVTPWGPSGFMWGAEDGRLYFVPGDGNLIAIENALDETETEAQAEAAEADAATEAATQAEQGWDLSDCPPPRHVRQILPL